MQVSFLLDENIAAPLAAKLAKVGHDVERLVDLKGRGSRSVDRLAVAEGAVGMPTADNVAGERRPRDPYPSQPPPSDMWLSVSRERAEGFRCLCVHKS